MSSYDPHGFLVIYSSADRSSFLVAERVLQTLWTSENIAQKAVILVGNKADLARSRLVSSEGELNSNLTFCGALKGNSSARHKKEVSSTMS
jgi:Rad/Gem-related GTP binding protein 1